MTTRPYLNLGIVAHVDAGKTSLTERLLYDAGVLDAPGSVDAGTTRTDSMDLERRRGITIRAAVTSFDIDDLAVNLVDTPGHPDFIAEVERSLTVLDAAVLVLSSVEGVQPQTVVIWRALRRIGVPTALFVNKVDRGGSDVAAVVAQVRRRLTSHVVQLARPVGEGTRDADIEAIPPDDETVVEAVAEVDERRAHAVGRRRARSLSDRIRAALRRGTRRGLAHAAALRVGAHRSRRPAAARRAARSSAAVLRQQPTTPCPAPSSRSTGTRAAAGRGCGCGRVRSGCATGCASPARVAPSP